MLVLKDKDLNLALIKASEQGNIDEVKSLIKRNYKRNFQHKNN